MDELRFREIVKRLEEVNKVIEKLDPSIRDQAFSFFKPYLLNDKKHSEKKDPDLTFENELNGDTENFFEKHEHEKPADNALLLAAYHYSQYGSEPFTCEEMKKLGANVGITIPERIDVTYRGSTRKNKNLFQNLGKGKFKPTVHGEGYLKNNYQVKKGNKTKEQDKVV